MLLDPPSFRRELDEHGWKCQLWPRVLWPGMEVDRLGNTKPAFPDVNDLAERMDESLTCEQKPVDPPVSAKKKLEGV